MSLSSEEKKLIGGSDAAAVAGLSRYKSPLDVWLRIVEGREPEQTKPMRRGQLLEPVVRQMYADETGAELLGPRSLRSKRHPFARASLDDVARLRGEERVLECKSANFRMLHAYGEGDDEIPDDYIAQVQWYLALAQLPIADVAVLLAGDELRIYTLRADAELQAALFEEAARFWRNYVVTKQPPPPDASPSYGEWLKRRFPKSDEQFLLADAEAVVAAEQLRKAREAKKAAEEAEEQARQLLQAKIGDAAGLIGPDFRINWKLTKGRATTDWRALCMELQVPPATVERFTKRAPYRCFKPQFSGVSADE
jgi:putative phage-type endonuclease